MRKKKIFAVAAIMAMAVFAAACGKKAEDSTKASTRPILKFQKRIRRVRPL